MTEYAGTYLAVVAVILMVLFAAYGRPKYHVSKLVAAIGVVVIAVFIALIPRLLVNSDVQHANNRFNGIYSAAHAQSVVVTIAVDGGWLTKPHTNVYTVEPCKVKLDYTPSLGLQIQGTNRLATPDVLKAICNTP